MFKLDENLRKKIRKEIKGIRESAVDKEAKNLWRKDADGH